MPEHDPASWTTIDTRAAFRNRWVSVALDTVQLPTGERYEYTRLEPAGIGVGIVGFNRAGEILLEREYRHGVGQVIWQIPGGLAAAGEDLQEAGLRELHEETGYAPAKVNAQTVQYLGAVWDNPALGTAMSHIYWARELVQVGVTSHDHGEYVALEWVTPAWLKDAVRQGQIQDRVVVASLTFLMLEGIL